MGFRDLKEFMPPFHARTNESKQFSLLLRAFAYNAWQINKSLTTRNLSKKKFCHDVEKASLSTVLFDVV